MSADEIGYAERHTECGHVGKFDCEFDAEVHRMILDAGDPGEGDVQSPSAWFAEFDIESGDLDAIEHYGSEWLIARELNDGRFFVEVYETSEAQQERLEILRAAYEEWDIDVLSGDI
ncbi:hypothetical protein SEA_ALUMINUMJESUS_92 [Microbacterium phage AluminumJesus]|nr:hypothetical protein SEA_BLAB_92 [Microbacterium phage Blab]UJD20827.1 hypothetical protein SEA_ALUMINUMJESUS_92 [Microbacterium phage AluminumJesus]UVG34463.1 hypothetical protein SEA_GAZEBO_94 [Microbacterium phage Gazebo]